MKKPKNFIPSLYKLALFLTGTLICAYFIWVRLILKRVPHIINFNWDPVKFALYVFLALLFLYILKKKIYPRGSKNYIIKKSKEFFVQKIIFWYNKSLDQILIFILDEYRIPFLAEIVYQSFYKISEIAQSQFFKKGYALYFYLLTISLPRLIIASAFFLDVVHFNQFYYLYKVIGLLIITLMVKIIVGVIEHMLDFYKNATKLYFDINIIPNDPKVTTKYQEGVIPVGIYVDRKNLTEEDVLHMQRVGYNPFLSEEEYREMEKFYWHLFCIEYYFLPIFDPIIGFPNKLIPKIADYTYLILYLLSFSYLIIRIGAERGL